MGFSTIGASVLIFIGLLFFSTTMANALFEAQRGLSEAKADDREREEFRRQTDVAVDSGAYRAGVLYLNATNRGATVLDLSRTALFIGGAWGNGAIDSRTIDGRITDLWSPGEIVRFEASWPFAPGRAYLVVETGHGIVWTS